MRCETSLMITSSRWQQCIKDSFKIQKVLRTKVSKRDVSISVMYLKRTFPRKHQNDTSETQKEHTRCTNTLTLQAVEVAHKDKQFCICKTDKVPCKKSRSLGNTGAPESRLGSRTTHTQSQRIRHVGHNRSCHSRKYRLLCLGPNRGPHFHIFKCLI